MVIYSVDVLGKVQLFSRSVLRYMLCQGSNLLTIS